MSAYTASMYVRASMSIVARELVVALLFPEALRAMLPLDTLCMRERPLPEVAGLLDPAWLLPDVLWTSERPKVPGSPPAVHNACIRHTDEVNRSLINLLKQGVGVVRGDAVDCPGLAVA